MDSDVEQLAQLAHQVLDVRARAAVDLRRVFAGEEGDVVPVWSQSGRIVLRVRRQIRAGTVLCETRQ